MHTEFVLVGLLSLFVLGYLCYTVLYPEKF